MSLLKNAFWMRSRAETADPDTVKRIGETANPKGGCLSFLDRTSLKPGNSNLLKSEGPDAAKIWHLTAIIHTIQRVKPYIGVAIGEMLQKIEKHGAFFA